VNTAELLQRIAKTLRNDVGPAVDAEYPKTQAFMAAVVLEKLSRELALAETHRVADDVDLRRLADELTQACGERGLPKRIAERFERFASTLDPQALCDVIESLYDARTDLGDARFNSLVGVIRRVLRTQLDRRLEFAK
jgi:hypothetical protein